MALSGKRARIRFTSASATNSTNEAATLSTDGVTLTIDSTSKRLWDRNSTLPSVFVSGDTGTVNADAKTIKWPLGVVAFSTPHSTAATYTVDVDYHTATYLTGGQSWTLDIAHDVLDVTSFSTSATNAQWRTFISSLAGASATLERLVSTGDTGPTYYDAIVAVSSNLITELWVDSTGNARYVMNTRINADGLADEIGDLARESVTFDVIGEPHYTTG